MPQESFEKILAYSFPGNVRELENILERAIVFSENSVIEEKYIMFANAECSLKAKHRSRLTDVNYF
jgi:transcriptional regulator with GAF, ATPase, and Fis domain